MRTFVLPYNPFSESAKKISEALGCRRIKYNNSRYTYRPGDVIINWGCSKVDNPEVNKATIINEPLSVSVASNKALFFKHYPGSRAYVIPYTFDRLEALEWQHEGETVVGRSVLNGHSGAGIDIVEPGEYLRNFPLYTRYQKKTDEYRVHFANGKLIKFARKGRKRDVPDELVNWKVRNLDGGFVFALWTEEDTPSEVLNACRAYVEVTDLHFGAIDVIYHRPTDKAYVLEVNTAPGLSGSTVQAYADGLKGLIKRYG